MPYNLKAMKQTLILAILDGWGIGREDESNPIHVVNPATFSFMKDNFPLTSLQASGISVGLPWGEVGNSEVGHLTIGAGKVLYQYFPKITLAIRDGSFMKNEAILGAIKHAQTNNSAVNLIGLLSKGNVHASLEHLEALMQMVQSAGVPLKLHLWSDGKDSAPHSLEDFLKHIPFANLYSLTGRYYAMDRESNWSLTKKAYEALWGKGGELLEDATALHNFITEYYRKGSNEEFLPVIRCKPTGIEPNDAIIFFNYREDSIRQISEAFLLKDFDEFPVNSPEKLYIATMTKYEDRFAAPVIFQPDTVEYPLGRVLSDADKTQLRLAETYKYAHVTYFFNGLVEPPFKNEYRVLIPSYNVPRVDEHPQMMASSITDRVLQALENQSFDFILANYANPDTIAHTGNYNAALEAVKTVDLEIGRLVKRVLESNAILVVTSDHGNMEELINPMTGNAETQHDPNPVPFYIVSNAHRNRRFSNQNSI